ncbi:MAG: SDR family oxidoreductase [Myxococcota bacterium]
MSSRSWAIVLGASSGFGAASALALARAGYNIAGVHLDTRATRARADAVAEACRNEGADVVFFNGNAADARRRSNALDALRGIDDAPHIAVLLHSLAFGSLLPMTGPPDAPRLSERHLNMTLDVMAHSLVFWTQDLIDAGWVDARTRILALTSSGSLAALPNYGAVSAAKAALEAHVRQLAAELAPRGIRVNALMAGVCNTPALQKIPGHPALLETAQRQNPSGRLTTPEDIASAILWMLHPGSQWVTGQVIPVDGGETIAGSSGFFSG